MMDIEHIKNKHCHDIISNYLPLARNLLYRLSYVNTHETTDEIEDYKSCLKQKLEEKIKEPLSTNISVFALQSVHKSLYYQCCKRDWKKEKMSALYDMKNLFLKWKLGLLEFDEENTIVQMHDEFCRISGYINFTNIENDLHDFICPFCIISSVYCDLGWTEFVCPIGNSSFEIKQRVSDRGIDKSIPTGGCEHIITTKKCPYDKLFAK